MQIKASMRYYFAFRKMAIIRKTDNKSSEDIVGGDAMTLEKSLSVLGAEPSIDLVCDPEIPIPDTDPPKWKS